MTVKWNTPSGNLGILSERQIVNINLLAVSDVGVVSMTVISGSLPRGLRLIGNQIRGSAVEVRKFTTSRFVVRADDGQDIEDRTFSLSVDGSDEPFWITKEGFLKVGPGDAYFVLDNAYVEFQLEASDPDLTAGDKLEFYLQPQGGELPLGLSLTKDGVISGFTDPIFSVEYGSRVTGAYDTAAFDTAPLDVLRNNSNGFDTFLYDNQTFDYFEETRAPRRLSRFYTFAVAVTDGIYTKNRIFKIYVVTEEFLKADNNILQIDTNLFQADSSSLRVPLWITPSNLGKFRANNYLTIFLDVFDPPSLPGVLTYFLLPTNPGTYKLKSSGEVITNGRYEITGIFPKFKTTFTGMWVADKEYKVGDSVVYTDISIYSFRGDWSITESYSFNDSVIHEKDLWRCLIPNTGITPDSSTVYWSKIISKTWICQNNNIGNAPSLSSTKWEVAVGSGDTFTPSLLSSWEALIAESASEIPPGMAIDGITGDIAGRVPYQSKISKFYRFTMLAVDFPPDFINANYQWAGNWAANVTYVKNQAVVFNNLVYVCIKDHVNRLPTDGEFWQVGVSSAEKTFSIELVGEIESGVEWISDSNIGTIKPNQSSQLTVEAKSLLYGGKVIYERISGKLPPGLEFLPNGLIKGKIKQFSDDAGPGLTRFFDKYINVSDLTGIFEDGDIIAGTSGVITAITTDLENNRIYYKGDSPTFTEGEVLTNGTITAKFSSYSKDFLFAFDGGDTSFDREFKFTVKARDISNIAESTKDFFFRVIADNDTIFSNVYILGLQPKEKRLEWFNFITDVDLFSPNDLYRYGDTNFGVQTELKILLFAGIESKSAVDFVQAVSRNHYRKRILFGDIKVGVAKDPLTQEILYEAIYVDIVDDLEKNGKSISQTVELPDNTNSRVLVSYDSIKVDSDIPFVSDRDHQRIFPNSIRNMRRRIKSIGKSDREFLPLWMRSIQSKQSFEPGYVKALVLCYAKPGRAESIINRIKTRTNFASRGPWNDTDFYQTNDTVEFKGSFYTCIINNRNVSPDSSDELWVKNFDFKNIDFEIDRYLIDSLDGKLEDKYLAFPQRGEKLP